MLLKLYRYLWALKIGNCDGPHCVTWRCKRYPEDYIWRAVFQDYSPDLNFKCTSPVTDALAMVCVHIWRESVVPSELWPRPFKLWWRCLCVCNCTYSICNCIVHLFRPGLHIWMILYEDQDFMVDLRHQSVSCLGVKWCLIIFPWQGRQTDTATHLAWQQIYCHQSNLSMRLAGYNYWGSLQYLWCLDDDASWLICKIQAPNKGLKYWGSQNLWW